MNFHNQKGVSTFWGISIILIEAIIVFFIFYILYFFWIENPTPTSNILIMKAFKEKTLTIPKAVDTTSWLTYSSSLYGLSLKYPAGYSISEDEIAYGQYEGSIISLTEQNQESFSLRFFSLRGDETIAIALERLTSVDPSIYQHFSEEVADKEAIVYRRAPNQTPRDYIYFIGNNYLFESAFDELSVQILATFQFID